MRPSFTKATNDGSRKKTIFLSYRKKDTESTTGRLFDTLRSHFSDEQIFMDMDKLEPGVDFEEVITKRLDDCDVMLAIIGPDWIGKNTDGTARIMNEKDWVRLEIGTALRRKIRVIPVLVEGASLPEEEQLPYDLRPLINRQKYEVTNSRWAYDTDVLVQSLHKHFGTSPAEPESESIWKRKSTWAFGAIGLAALIFLVVKLSSSNSPSDQTLLQNASTTTENTSDEESTNGTENTYEPGEVQGDWRVPDGDTTILYNFIQNGTTLIVKEYQNGIEVRSGEGTITGQELIFTLGSPDGEQGTVKAVLSNDGKELKQVAGEGENISEADLFHLVRD